MIELIANVVSKEGKIVKQVIGVDEARIIVGGIEYITNFVATNESEKDNCIITRVDTGLMLLNRFGRYTQGIGLEAINKKLSKYKVSREVAKIKSSTKQNIAEATGIVIKTSDYKKEKQNIVKTRLDRRDIND